MKIIPAHLKHFPAANKLFSGSRVSGETFVLKADLNATLEKGIIQNPRKLGAAFPSIDRFLSLGANIIILSHLGRPTRGYDPHLSLRPVYTFLASRYAEYGVAFAGDAMSLSPGQFLTSQDFTDSSSAMGLNRIMLMENVRFAAAEQARPGEPAYEELAKALLGLGGGRVIYEAAAVWDKTHASVAGILRAAGLNNAAWGFHAHDEITKLVRSFTGKIPQPYVIHISGTKPEKIKAIGGFLDNPNVNSILVSGNLANAFLEAQGISVGEAAGIYDQELVSAVMKHARFKDVVSLPTDFVIAKPDGSDREEVGLNGIRPGFRQFDIGSETARHYANILAGAQTTVNSGVAGVFDLPENPFEDGTRTILRGFAQAQAKTILGGEGGVAARLYLSGEELGGIEINVGGGSILHFMAFQTCPVAEAFLALAGVDR